MKLPPQIKVLYRRAAHRVYVMYAITDAPPYRGSQLVALKETVPRGFKRRRADTRTCEIIVDFATVEPTTFMGVLIDPVRDGAGVAATTGIWPVQCNSTRGCRVGDALVAYSHPRMPPMAMWIERTLCYKLCTQRALGDLEVELEGAFLRQKPGARMSATNKRRLAQRAANSIVGVIVQRLSDTLVLVKLGRPRVCRNGVTIAAGGGGTFSFDPSLDYATALETSLGSAGATISRTATEVRATHASIATAVWNMVASEIRDLHHELHKAKTTLMKKTVDMAVRTFPVTHHDSSNAAFIADLKNHLDVDGVDKNSTVWHSITTVAVACTECVAPAVAKIVELVDQIGANATAAATTASTTSTSSAAATSATTPLTPGGAGAATTTSTSGAAASTTSATPLTPNVAGAATTTSTSSAAAAVTPGALGAGAATTQSTSDTTASASSATGSGGATVNVRPPLLGGNVAGTALPLADFMLARKITVNPGLNRSTADMQHVLPDISGDTASIDLLTRPFVGAQLAALNTVSNTAAFAGDAAIGNALTDAFANKNTQQPYQGELFWNAVNNFKGLAAAPQPGVSASMNLVWRQFTVYTKYAKGSPYTIAPQNIVGPVAAVLAINAPVLPYLRFLHEQRQLFNHLARLNQSSADLRSILERLWEQTRSFVLVSIMEVVTAAIQRQCKMYQNFTTVYNRNADALFTIMSAPAANSTAGLLNSPVTVDQMFRSAVARGLDLCIQGKA